jgi:hypothetical protein
MSAPAPTISAELKTVLRHVKLGRCLDTLPERLALAKARNLGHAEFLELVLSDEVTGRETSSAALRARTAGLDPAMSLDNWDDTTKVSFDRQVFDELCSLRFVDAGHNVVVMGPVGVGKTFLAHRARPRRGPSALHPSSSSAPTPCSNDSVPRGSTTATTPRSANCCASTSSSSTTSPSKPSTRSTPPMSTNSSSNATGPRPPS